MTTKLASDSSAVSVVLAYRNREDVLGQAVASVLDQSHRDLELILVDDASTDDSALIAHSIQDSRIHHVSLAHNQGVSGARNAGLQVASHRLLAFMDSDDAWLPNKLTTQVEWLRRAQDKSPCTSVVGCGWTMMSGASSKVFHAGPYSFRHVLFTDVAGIGTPMLLVDREAAASTDPKFDTQLPALVDRDFVLTCLANGSELSVVPVSLVLVRRGREDHVANNARAGAAYERLLEKYRQQLGEEPSARALYAYRACREYVQVRDTQSVRRLLKEALQQYGLRRSAHLAAGYVGRSSGLAAAQRLLPLPPNV